MKFKQKFIGWLGSAVIATTAISAIASCAFRRHVVDYKTPDISFKGSGIISPQPGDITGSLTGFEFSRPLYDGESVTAVLVSTDSDNDVEMESVTASYQANSDQMSVDCKISAPSDDEIYLNHKIEFKLQFMFKYDGKDYGPVTVPDVFTFNYSAKWKPNTIKGEAIEYTTPANSKEFNINEFELDRALNTNPEYIEALDIEVINNENVHIVGDPSIGTDKKISITLSVDCPDWEASTATFGLKFTFKFLGNIVATETKENIVVNVTRVWEPNKLHYINENDEDDPAIVFSPANGETTYTTGTDAFYLDRPLKELHNEELKISISPDDDSQKPDDYNWDALKLADYTVVGKMVTLIFTLNINPKEGEIYRTDLEFKDFNIHWSITENEAGGHEEKGTFEDVSFKYLPAILDNNVTPYNFVKTAGEVELRPDENVNGWTFTSDTAIEPTGSGFKLDNLLTGGTTLDVELLTESGDELNDKLVLAGQPTYPIGQDGDGNPTQFLNFSVMFKNTPQEDTSEKFKLRFIFKNNNQALVRDCEDHIFELFYNYEAVESGDYVPNLNPNYAGANHGDIIVPIVGKLDENHQQITEDTEYSISLNSYIPQKEGQATLSILPDDTEAKTKGAKIDLDGTITIYARISPNDQAGANKFDYTQPFDFTNVKFTFNFTDSKTKENSTASATTSVTYTPFSPNMEAYIKARTVPLNLKYKTTTTTGTGYERTFGDAWILAKAPSADGKIHDEDVVYYVATSAAFKHTFETWCEQYHTQDEFSYGITDQRFASDYNYIKGDREISEGEILTDDDLEPWTACDYRYDYIYCNYEHMTFESDSNFIWHTDEPSFWGDWNGYNYICDMAIAKVDFSDLMEIEIGSKIDDAKKVAYVNKLYTLNNYYKTYHHVNNFRKNDSGNETTITNNEFTNGTYSGFATGGFPAHQHRVYDPGWEGGTMTRTQWDYKTITPSDLNYGNGSWFAANGRDNRNSGSYMWRTTNVALVSYYYYYHSSPTYYINSKVQKIHEYLSGGGYGDDVMFGSMFVGQRANYGVGEDGIELLGLYRGANDSDSDYYYPYIELWQDHEKYWGSDRDLIKGYVENGTFN